MNGDLKVGNNGGPQKSENEFINKVKIFSRNAKRKFNRLPQLTKLILFSCLAVIILVMGFLALSKSSEEDGRVDTSNIELKIHVDGYNGHAKAWAEAIGKPSIKALSDKDNYEEIEKEINEPEIELSKEKDIKNGDEIKAILKFKSDKFKIKFSKEIIEEKIIVEGLKILFNSIGDIKERDLAEMDNKSREKIAENYSYDRYSNVNISLIKAYERKNDEEDIKNGLRGGNGFKCIFIYKVVYNEGKYSKKQKYDLQSYEFYNFEDKNGNLEYLSAMRNSAAYANSLSSIDERLSAEGFSEYKELRNINSNNVSEIGQRAAEVSGSEESNANNPNEEKARELVGKILEVKKGGNLRTEPGLNTSVIKMLKGGTKVEVIKAQADYGRIWCYVKATTNDGNSYEGWISTKVLK